MAANKSAPRIVVLPLILLIGLLAVIIAVYASRFRGWEGKSTVRLSDEAVLELHIIELISSEERKAADLASEGQHLQAARMLINIAGTRRVIRQSDVGHGIPGVTMVTEKMALQQLSLIGKDRPYREFLQSLYPEWKEEGSRNGRINRSEKAPR